MRKERNELKARIAELFFGGIMAEKVEEATQAAVQRALQGIPSLLTYDASMAGFRRLVGNSQEQASLRDLPMPTHERMQEIAYYLYLTNPMAQWLLQMMTSYVLGEGVTLVAEDERTDAIVQAFWTDPINAWPVKLENKVRELSLYGEQCWPTFVAPGTGRVRLGYLDPCLIGTVVLDPDNAEQPIGIVTKTWTNYRPQPERRYRVILDVPDEELTPAARAMRAEFTDGDCFYVAVNKVSNGSRGVSDLLAKADWLDGFEQFLFNRLERADLANRLVVDVEMQGLTPEQIAQQAKDFRLPNPGGAHIHNEKTKVEMKAPKLEAADAAVDARLFKHQCLSGFPEHWYGGGSDVNRATAAEMDEPTFKLLESRQNAVKHMVLAVARHAIRQAKRAGTLPQAAEEKVQAQFPEMVKADLGKLAGTFDTVSRVAVANVAATLMTEEEARQLIALAVKPLGIELTPMTQEELDALAAERALRTAMTDYGREASLVKREASDGDNNKPKAEGGRLKEARGTMRANGNGNGVYAGRG